MKVKDRGGERAGKSGEEECENNVTVRKRTSKKREGRMQRVTASLTISVFICPSLKMSRQTGPVSLSFGIIKITRGSLVAILT